jgi:amidase
MSNLSLLDAVGSAELVRRKEITPLELVDAAIARVERLNPAINAVVTDTFDRARTEAKGTLPDGPFRGVPFLLKDVMGGADQGVRLTVGSKFLQSHVARADTELVKRFKRAGLVVIGRTNTPEFSIPPATEPALFGATKNPWNLAYSSGGSSGGAAAAVASRMVPVAHASDAGGSIRIPASCTGVFGLKPTRARNTMAPRLGESVAGLVAEHCVSISVRDSAAFLDATSGPAPGDPYAAPAPARPYLQEIGANPGRLRVAVMRTPLNGANVDADCLEALESAVALCKELGHELVDEQVVLSEPGELLPAFFKVWTLNAAMSLASAEAIVGRDATPDDVEPVTWALAEMGRTLSAVDYEKATRTLHRVSRDVAALYERADVLLTPTLAQPPLLLGAIDNPPDEPLRGFFRSGAFAAFTPLFNITGQPAMSVPLFWNAAGLPIGVQFAARFGDETTLFRLASQLESARPWAARLPKIS